MRKHHFFIGLVAGIALFVPAKMAAQCPNLNFGSGTLDNWQCYAGSCAGGNYYSTPVAPIPGKHTIMDAAELISKGQFFDENCNKIPKVPDGYNYSCRIGDDSRNAETNGIEYEMTVDSNNSLLILSFAFVMENPGHSLPDQPHFTMKIMDSAGRVLNVPCGNVNFSAQDSMTGLACETSSLVARNWTTVGFNLESVIGQKIKLFFETWDCTLGDHFGYAYVVAECRPMKINLQFCDGQTVARFIAPEGFESYTWTRTMQPNWVQHTRQINIVDPWDGEEFMCIVKSELGCESTLRARIARTSIDANFYHGVKDANGYVPLPEHHWESWYDTCSRTATFVDRVNVHNSTKGGIEWAIQQLPNVRCYDSLFTYTFPDPPTDTPVTYNVRLTAYTENGCVDTSRSVWKHITIYPSPKVKIAGPNYLCMGDSANLIATPIRSAFISHEWSGIKADGTPIPPHAGDTLEINSLGIYYLASLDTDGCYAHDTLVVAPLKPTLENLTINDVACWGEATGFFRYYSLSGGQPPYDTASWVIWRNGKLDTANLGGNTGYMYFWDLPAGTYTFYAKDAVGCEFRDTIRIQQPDLLDTTAYSAIFCKDESYSDHNFTNLTEEGTYYKTLQSINGCDSVVCLTLTEKSVPAVTTLRFTETDYRFVIVWHRTTPFYQLYRNDELLPVTNLTSYTDNNLMKGVTYCYKIKAIDDCESEWSDTICQIFYYDGIAETHNYSSLRVYPNPTKGQLIIKNEEVREVSVIEIYGVEGQLLQSTIVNPQSEITIDVSHLASGMYFLKAGNKVVKFVKE